MYTQCPQCHTAFEIGPEDLRQAHGRVRCGQCHSVFDALRSLSHEPPRPGAQRDAAESESELEFQPEAEPEPEPEPEPQRLDDNTPLDDVLASPGEPDEGYGREDEREIDLPGETPAGAGETAAAGDQDETSDTTAFGDEDEWRALLAELDLDDETGADIDTGELLLAEDDEEAAQETEPPMPEAAATEESAPLEPGPGEAPEPGEDDDLASSAALFDELVQSGQFASILGPDPDTADVAGDQAVNGTPGEDRQEEPPPLEELPQTAAGREAAAAEASAVALPEEEEEDRLFDRELLPRRSRRRTLMWSAAAVLLVLALGAQVIHGQRAYIATHPALGPQIDRFYSLFGARLEPHWDIGALCVESSSGDAGDDALQITSVIVHRGDRPQPYPLLHVALTDRWQSVIGSRTIPATDYLPDDALRDLRVRPGARIRASTTLSDPGGEAAGYELHVCYRDAESGLRCSGACL